MTARHGLLVVDASVVVALVVDNELWGDWVQARVAGNRLAAPSLLAYEVGDVLRRLAARDPEAAAAGYVGLLAVRIDTWPHGGLAARAWELRGAVSYYDAAYVALAELLDAPLLTLDRRLARAPGPRCAFLTPPD